MDDLVLVEVVHPCCNLFGPVHQLLGGHLLPLPQHVEQGAVGAVLHDDAVAGRLGAHPSTIQ